MSGRLRGPAVSAPFHGHAEVWHLDETIKIRAADVGGDGKFSALEGKLDGLKDKLHSLTVWALLLYIGLAGSLLTVLAKGFKWF